MTDMPIYYASELNPDTCLNIAMFLFATRRNSKLTITEAAVRTCPLKMWTNWKRKPGNMILQKSRSCWIYTGKSCRCRQRV